MSTMLTLAERAVPRYTSYPTAPHFSAAVEAQTYAEWLAALPDTAKLSLYLHVPLLRLHHQGGAPAGAGRGLCRSPQKGDRTAGRRHRRQAGRAPALGRRHA